MFRLFSKNQPNPSQLIPLNHINYNLISENDKTALSLLELNYSIHQLNISLTYSSILWYWEILNTLLITSDMINFQSMLYSIQFNSNRILI
jgi:hypothetical protein